MSHYRCLIAVATLVFAAGLPVLASPALASSGSHPSLAVLADTVPAGIDGRHSVLVRLHGPALAAYAGGISGLAPTAPALLGEHKLDVDSPAARAYLDHLAQSQATQLARISSLLRRELQPQFRLSHVLNAVALRLTLDEALRLERSGLASGVELDSISELLGDVSAGMIGAPFSWHGGGNNGVANRGEGVVIGFVDGGIRHAHPSFAAVAPGDGYVHSNPRGSGNVLGLCVAQPALCNHKLIGSYDFTGSVPGGEDIDGHGTAVASLAAGNALDATVAGLSIPVSGVAPRANIISYRACSLSCTHSALVAAIEQAVIDGVDVLHVSVTGPDDPWNNAVDLALRDAAAAGVFVVNSAGGNGFAAGSVMRTSPWAATVTVTTHPRLIGNDIDAAGLSLRGVPGAGPGPGAALTAGLIDAAAAFPANALGCAPFAVGAFSGSVVLIERGSCTFATKIEHAATAGAVGVLIFNNVGGPPISMSGTESTSVPAFMIDRPSGLALRALIDGISMATLYGATSVSHHASIANLVHATGGRGPSKFDMVKPDFAAPGIDSLVASIAASGGDFALTFGTSMAAANVSGAAALLVGDKPGWSPAALRSALALTARRSGLRTHSGIASANVLDAGSGLIDVGVATRAPIVMEEGNAAFVAANPAAGGDPRTLNLPGLLDRDCVGSCTFVRIVKSVIGESQDYVVSSSAAAGIGVVVTPAAFTLAPGASQQLQVDVSVNAGVATRGSWHFGEVAIEPTGAARARLIDQGFDGLVFPPPGWSIHKLAGGGPQQWSQSTAVFHSPPASARFVFGTVVDGHQDGWLVTPRLLIPGAAELHFVDIATWMVDYLYHGVWASTGSCNPLDAEFAELREVHDSPVGSWRASPLQIDLSAYSDRMLCLAFRYRGTNASAWYIDDVRIVTPQPVLRLPLAVHAAVPVVAIAPATLARAVRHDSYSAMLGASGDGASAPYTFSVTAGALPPGVTLGSNGQLSGVPTTLGSFSFTVTAQDSSSAGDGGPFSGVRAYTLQVTDRRIFRDGFEG
jgi:hypothetical protein